MADPNGVDETRYIYNGTIAFPVSRVVRSRTGYMGKKVYTKIGSLSPHPVSWIRYTDNYVPIRAPSGSPVVSITDFRSPTQHANSQGVTVAGVRDIATIRIYSQLANANAMLPLILKERQQTINMVADTVMGLVQYKRSFLKQLRKHYKGNDNKVIHNKWLEYRYGWTPFLMDINTLLNKPLGLPSTRVFAGASKSFSDTYLAPGNKTMKCSGTINVRMSSIVLARNPFMSTLQQYGISNPSLVIWEAVPYSFVADWVFNIGGYLESLGALQGLELIDPSWTWSLSANHETSTYSTFNGSRSYGFAFRSTTSGERTLGLPSYPNPLIPSNGMNLSRFLDGAALLRNLFDTKK